MPASELELSVVIVGGGIGGLATALALQHRGIEAHVFEQAAELTEVGAGVLVTPNGMRVLEALDVGRAVADVGGTVSEGSMYHRMDGTPIGPILTTDSAGWNGMYGMHRADLLEVLVKAIPSDHIHTGHTCLRYEEAGGRAAVSFSNGAVVLADAVIGADGIHSVLRDYVAPPQTPVHSGSVAYRGLVEASAVPEWNTTTSQLWMGDGKHFLTYPVRRGELINYVGFVPSQAETRESWSSAGDPVALARAFRGWDPKIESLLSHVDATFWWGLYDREPLETWTRGRLALLGDAAHPMLPHLGQGANQAMEDALTLALALEGVIANDVPDALQAYEQLRIDRTTSIQEGARANGRRYDSAYDDLEQRDAEIRASAEFRKWLYDHDAVGHARSNLGALRGVGAG